MNAVGNELAQARHGEVRATRRVEKQHADNVHRKLGRFEGEERRIHAGELFAQLGLTVLGLTVLAVELWAYSAARAANPAIFADRVNEPTTSASSPLVR